MARQPTQKPSRSARVKDAIVAAGETVASAVDTTKTVADAVRSVGEAVIDVADAVKQEAPAIVAGIANQLTREATAEKTMPAVRQRERTKLDRKPSAAKKNTPASKHKPPGTTTARTPTKTPRGRGSQTRRP